LNKAKHDFKLVTVKYQDVKAKQVRIYFDVLKHDIYVFCYCYLNLLKSTSNALCCRLNATFLINSTTTTVKKSLKL